MKAWYSPRWNNKKEQFTVRCYKNLENCRSESNACNQFSPYGLNGRTFVHHTICRNEQALCQGGVDKFTVLTRHIQRVEEFTEQFFLFLLAKDSINPSLCTLEILKPF